MENSLAAAGIYVGLNTLIFLWIANETGKVRRREGIALGDGGNAHLARMMRGTANATEYIPMFVIALLTAAAMGMPAMAVHILGVIFTVGRGIHASYFIDPAAPIRRRFIGFGIALAAQSALVIGLIVHGVWTLSVG